MISNSLKGSQLVTIVNRDVDEGRMNLNSQTLLRLFFIPKRQMALADNGDQVF